MKIRIIPIVLCFSLAFVSHVLFSQSKNIRITGTVVESKRKQPIEFATVIIGDSKTQKPITGVTTAIDGTFDIYIQSQDFYVEISFIGFITQTIKEVSIIDGRLNLGTILLAEDSEVLDEVFVRADKSQTEFRLDKRVFNVGKDLSSTGASVLEVLNNVPSVNVNIEGEISLRGSSGVQILINGKPSVLASEQGNALGTITAEMIEKIEVITNPSAKYESEGTSGIINIVIKKEDRKGFNGSISLNTGIPHNHSLGISLNRRTEKFNLFSQLGVGYRELPHDVKNIINQDLSESNSILTEGTEYRNELFYNLILGTDYHINSYNVLTLSGYFAYEIEDQPSLTNFSLTNKTDITASQWIRNEITKAYNPKWQYEIQYKRDFPDNKNHALLFSALGVFFGKDLSSDFNNTTTIGNDGDRIRLQQTRTEFEEAKYIFKLDYTKPFSNKMTLETGTQYVVQDVSNDYLVNNFVQNSWMNDAGFTNIFEYGQKVLGIYGTGAYEHTKWGVKLGLRLEATDLNTLLTNISQANNQNYISFFPSVHTSYKLTKRLSLQAGYSRRVFRPRLWDLNPFFNIRNNYSIRIGNPALQPEFTDSYEITTVYEMGKISFNFALYHRYVTDVIERVFIFENNINTYKPLNIGINQSTGVEFNTKYTLNDWLSINGDFNYNYFNRQGSFENTSLNFSADQWSIKWIAKFKLPKQIDFEITGNYRSKYKTVQGVISNNTFANLGLRKKIMKNKGTINLSIRDIFASRVWEMETNQSESYIYSRRQRGRFITLGLNYSFGKGEAMEYSGQRRRF